MTGEVGEVRMTAVGSAPWPIVTVCVVELDAPMLSIAVSVTLNVPADRKVCCTTSPLPVLPSPKFHSHCTSVPVVDVLCLASNSVTSPSAPVVTVKRGVTLPRGGTVVPLGTTRIVAVRAVLLAKSLPLGVTTTCTSVAGTPVPAAAGAVKTTVARPLASVTTLRADSDPKSTSTPPTARSTRSDWLRSGEPFWSRAVMVTSDCDAPSCVTTSGLSVIEMAVDSSDGPVSGGVGVSFVVQAPRNSSAAPQAAAVMREVRFDIIESRLTAQVGEIDFEISGDADLASRLIVTVEGHACDRADVLRSAVTGQCLERRFVLGLGTHQREPDRCRAGHRHRHASVECERNVHPLHVMAVAADVLHVVLRHGDRVHRARGESPGILHLQRERCLPAVLKDPALVADHVRFNGGAVGGAARQRVDDEVRRGVAGPNGLAARRCADGHRDQRDPGAPHRFAAAL